MKYNPSTTYRASLKKQKPLDFHSRYTKNIKLNTHSQTKEYDFDL